MVSVKMTLPVDMQPIFTGYWDWRGRMWKTEDKGKKAVRNTLSLTAWSVLLQVSPRKPLCRLQTCTEIAELSSAIAEGDDNKDNDVF